MVMEPSLGPSGQLKTSRKGVGHFTITVRGRAAHAGLNPEKGISAILELSHVVQTLFRLNEPDRGVSVNVGIIDGGTRPNVVASQSRAEVDVRVRTKDDAAMIEKAIHSLQPVVPGTELQIQGRIARPPMESTPMSTARTAGPVSARCTSGEGRPGPLRSFAGPSVTIPRSASSLTRVAIVVRLRPVLRVRSDRDCDPTSCSSLRMMQRLCRRTTSAVRPWRRDRAGSSWVLGFGHIVLLCNKTNKGEGTLPGETTYRQAQTFLK